MMGWGVVQVVKYLPSKHKVLSSKPNTIRKREREHDDGDDDDNDDDDTRYGDTSL
jgi:hypothetical protein